ncbi:hypothetical protein BpHYR1_029048 [Brachionus plicatilis]|uniref:Uncharacterized protein n=1 Tax=Brachionus plicatilis TaxID=10195 RepID=A0A3M7QJ66_BRAPC|nr:hypothetical protein BpHYR1_029048 [Brachionus plicatilis]
MGSFVNFQIFGSGEHFATSEKRTSERLLASVHSNLVLGLERLALANAVLPVAYVHVLVRAADMVDGQMSHDVVHAIEKLIAVFVGVRVDPSADDLAFLVVIGRGGGRGRQGRGRGGRLDGLRTHVAQEGARIGGQCSRCCCRTHVHALGRRGGRRRQVVVAVRLRVQRSGCVIIVIGVGGERVQRLVRRQ